MRVFRIVNIVISMTLICGLMLCVIYASVLDALKEATADGRLFPIAMGGLCAVLGVQLALLITVALITEELTEPVGDKSEDE